ncbi:hypothetical protein [Arthrobacter sp. AL12]|uniref:hypothetical protein n=1 Tax=Arthrobacter sp. AL12 TaxID=3042241 RepID=UPI00249A30F5|nr:hypothetical protein [Arthrobacter sp. AL12]MDI3211021.1 hypothetical protein [Arthrobacter sp. AL12]
MKIDTLSEEKYPDGHPVSIKDASPPEAQQMLDETPCFRRDKGEVSNQRPGTAVAPTDPVTP